MNFTSIPEPTSLKQQMQDFKKTAFPETESGIDWDSSVVWSGNRLTKFLWDNGNPELKDQGFIWQSFSKLLRYRTDKMILWYRGELCWKDLVQEIADLMNSSIGQNLTRKK